MPEETIVREAIDKAHHRDRFWMILFPVIVISLIVIALIVLLSVNGGLGGTDTASFAGVATVMLVLPALLFGLITLVILIGLGIGVSKLRGVIPQGGKALRDYLSIGKDYLRKGGDASAKPILALGALNAKIKQIGISFTDRFSRKG